MFSRFLIMGSLRGLQEFTGNSYLMMLRQVPVDIALYNNKIGVGRSVIGSTDLAKQKSVQPVSSSDHIE
ncbi:MAG: hypothetical protein ACQEUT_18720 [Bacillota bacterium]